MTTITEPMQASKPLEGGGIWIPLQHEPMIAGGGSLLHQSIPSWLLVIGRLRRDASIAGMAPRLTEILRQWIQYDVIKAWSRDLSVRYFCL